MLRMLRLSRLIKVLVLFVPTIFFMYTTVELLAERSASLSDMEVAYLKLQQQRRNNLIEKEVISDDKHRIDLVSPAEDTKLRYIEGTHAHKAVSRMVGAANDYKIDGVQAKDTRRDKLGVQKNMAEPSINLSEDDSDVTFPPFVEERRDDGPGEGGVAVIINVTLLSPEEKERYDEGWRHNSFNQYLSDRISVHRSLPDSRTPECKEQKIATNLPDISVIIIFHNEAWSVLLRSVYSILERTPEHLLREIILVDDLSNMEHLKRPLEKYWKREPKVKIVRARERSGLTRARLLGYEIATAPVLVFLDSHIECFEGWLEPLLDRLVEEPRAVLYPNIEIIYDHSFSVTQTEAYSRAIFRWKDLTFQWEFVPDYEKKRRKSPIAPIRSPTMPGGLFAIRRDYFTTLGTYDPKLDYWGGENIELSFKAWMCNGSVELVPCSHIGHIYRRSNPIPWNGNVGSKNSLRVAEVWMDDFKNYYHERISYIKEDFGDVTDRKRLRERLHCHDFKWYMENVYPNADIPRNVIGAGEIRNIASQQCLDSMGHNDPPKMYYCHGMGGNQFWYLTADGNIYQDFYICEMEGKILQLANPCSTGNWAYREDKTLMHVSSKMCLEASASSPDLSLVQCSDAPWQKWNVTARRKDLVFP